MGRLARCSLTGEMDHLFQLAAIALIFSSAMPGRPNAILSDRSDPDRWVYKLYKDLCDEILQMTDAQPEEAGFMDRDNKLGAEWSPELMAALEACRVFVPLIHGATSKATTAAGNGSRSPAGRSFTGREDGEGVRCHRPGPLDTGWTGTRSPRWRSPFSTIMLILAPATVPRLLRDHEAAELPAPTISGRFIVWPSASSRLVTRASRMPTTTLQDMDRKDFESLPSAFGPASARRTTDGQLQITVLAHDTSTLPPGPGQRLLRRNAAHLEPVPAGLSRSRWPITRVELAKKCLDCEPLLRGLRRTTRRLGQRRAA